MKRHPVMAGNWKMYKTVADTEAYLLQLIEQLKSFPSLATEVILCVPFTSLQAAMRLVQTHQSRIRIAAQTMEAATEGAFTGEISAVMLAELGVHAVVLGHSERRQYYNETDKTVNAKIKSALQHHLTPIVCVGELLSEREAGLTDTIVTQQVVVALEGLSAEELGLVIIAYEPVWAIGTGKVCEAQEANRVIAFIRKTMARDDVRIVYGGSVKPDNIDGLMALSDIDGGLVGGASLEVGSFFKLIEATEQAAQAHENATLTR
jgi:triosephosphate isomerase (TIM)